MGVTQRDDEISSGTRYAWRTNICVFIDTDMDEKATIRMTVESQVMAMTRVTY